MSENITKDNLKKLESLNKTEVSFEDLKNSKDWEQALIVVTYANCPETMPIESRTYLTTIGSDYFNDSVESTALPCINISFNESIEDLTKYLSGEIEPKFEIVTCYKLWDVYDINFVLNTIRSLNDVVDYDVPEPDDIVDEIEE